MNHEQQLQLQAYLDGELSDREAREVTDWIANDQEARDLFAELQFTKTALVENEPVIPLPESREFFWSKIEREIRQSEAASARSEQPLSVLSWLQRILLPATSVALIAMLAIVLVNRSNDDATVSTLAMHAGEVEIFDDMSTMTFRSEAERMTVVWVYNNDSGVAKSGSTFNSYE